MDILYLFGSQNFDLLTVAIVTAAIGILGIIILFNNSKSITNRTFFVFSIVTIIYAVINYSSYQVTEEVVALWLLRFILFFAVWHTLLIFQLFFIFPKEKQLFPKKYKFILLPIVAITSILTLTPFVFSGIAEIGSVGNAPTAIHNPGIAIFGLVTTGLVISGIFILFRKMIQAKGVLKKQFITILSGSVMTFSLILIFNVYFPLVHEITDFIIFAPIFFFPFLVFMGYAVLKQGLFNIKVAAIGILTFLLSTVVIIRVVFESGIEKNIFNIGEFILVLVFSAWLIKSVKKEIQQREQIQKLAIELEKANVKLKELDKLKSQFVSIASHQLRSPITSIKGYTSLILEGSFGKVSDSVREALQKIFDSTELMVTSIQDFLDVSKIEQGEMTYDFEVFDLKKVLKIVADEQIIVAKKKGLAFALTMDEKEEYRINGDYGKIKQVVSNIVDNSIKYTPKGSVKITLTKNEHTGKILIEIIDTGVGISADTIPKLFDRFVRAGSSHSVNVTGTGLGLYVAKQMVGEHKGRIWVTSEGLEKGSTFHIELNEYRR